MPKLSLCLRIEGKIDTKVEGAPRYRLRASPPGASVLFSPREEGKWQQVEVDLPALDPQSVFFIDLYADTICSKPGAPRTMVGRSFSASVVCSWQELCMPCTVMSTDMVEHNVKFTAAFDPDKSTWDGKSLRTDVWPTIKADVETFRTRVVPGYMRVMFEAAKQSNHTYASQKDKWLDYSIHHFNASYVDALISPLVDREGGARVAIPGWVDLLHLTTVSVDARRTLLYVEHTVREACRHMGVSVSEFLGADPASPLACEVACDAAASYARGRIYINDVVHIAGSSDVPVDHYGFPSITDNPDQAGDDCESLSKEVLLFVAALEKIQSTSETPCAARAQQIAGAHIWYLIKGAANGEFQGIDNSKATLKGGRSAFCHSWVLGVPRSVNSEWLRRGDAVLGGRAASGGESPSAASAGRFVLSSGSRKERTETKKLSGSGSGPQLLWIESTEYTTAVLRYGHPTFEERRTKLGADLQQDSTMRAFRSKLTSTLVKSADYYGFVVSGLTWQLLGDQQCCEFVFATVHPDGTFSKSVRFGDFSDVALLPVHIVTEEEKEVADHVVRWLPSVRARTMDRIPTESKSEPDVDLLYLRKSDWNSDAEARVKQWCGKTGRRFVGAVAKQTTDTCFDVEVAVVMS